MSLACPKHEKAPPLPFSPLQRATGSHRRQVRVNGHEEINFTPADPQTVKVHAFGLKISRTRGGPR